MPTEQQITLLEKARELMKKKKELESEIENPFTNQTLREKNRSELITVERDLEKIKKQLFETTK